MSANEPVPTSRRHTQLLASTAGAARRAALSDIGACVFDVYGTLFDYASAALRCQDALGADWAAISDLWRRKQLEYTWLRSLMGRHADFWQVTGESLDYALAAHDRRDPTLHARLMDQYLHVAPYPEVRAVLQQLQSRKVRTAVLSNGSPSMLRATLDGAELGSLIGATLSAEDVAIYKPHPSVYQLAVNALGVYPAQICFLSSNGWDAAGAASFGFCVVWVNRLGAPPEYLPAKPDHEIRDLSELLGLFGF